ncbi:MAG: hypothetical protein IPO93_05970 [Actinobacteria bacterium]|nr:hypothetical protein [Actinomycetota bacterium]
MRATEQLGRYRLLDLVTQDAGVGETLDVYLWHAFDETLDRAVAIRVMSADDPRAAAVLGAAQAAARVDDRRLLRVLDILNLPATATDGARIAVVSEWASGRNLERTIEDRGGRPFAPAEALSLSADVARALAAGTAMNVSHGRLRPSSVFITDAGEVRIRGLAVDAALFGAMPETGTRAPTDRAQGDVDALGCLVYLLTTGYWPGAEPISAPSAPRANGVVLPPSQVRAAVPRGIDDVVARSVSSAARPRGVARVVDAAAFATMVGAALDHVAPVASVAAMPRTRVQRTAHVVGVVVFRLVAVAAAAALVFGIAWVGWQLLSTSSSTSQAESSLAIPGLLTAAARPADDIGGGAVETTFPITRYRSYDPFGDDNGNGKPDKRRGRENEELVVTVNDVDLDTAWLTSEYGTPDLDGKEGVGLVLDLGQPRDVQQLSLGLVGTGSNVDVRVADKVLGDPALWTPLASAVGAKDTIELRAPRPITGRYVLIWLTRVPPAVDATLGVYQGGVRNVVVRG